MFKREKGKKGREESGTTYGTKCPPDWSEKNRKFNYLCCGCGRAADSPSEMCWPRLF